MIREMTCDTYKIYYRPNKDRATGFEPVMEPFYEERSLNGVLIDSIDDPRNGPHSILLGWETADDLDKFITQLNFLWSNWTVSEREKGVLRTREIEQINREIKESYDTIEYLEEKKKKLEKFP